MRLSLDSGTNDTFIRMHKPVNKKITLEGICEWVPKIKAIVENSVEGLNYDKISVALFPVKAVEIPAGPPMKQLLGVQVAADSYDSLMSIVVGLGAAALVSLGTLVYGVQRRNAKPAAAAAE